MQELEIEEYIKVNELMNPGMDFSYSYTFYYDETNNIRKFHVISREEFNSSFHANFVLGGFLTESEKPNFDSLISGLQLQSTINEIKLKYLAKGDFRECLGYPKLEYFLKYVLNSSLYAHYSSINLLYYSIVDIVDSAIFESSVSGQLGMAFTNGLKNDLYRLSKLEIDRVIDLFYRFQYPNIKSDQVLGFIQELTDLFAGYEDEFEFHVGLTSMRQMLKEAKKKNSLSFIMGEEDHILMKDFSSFYLRPLYTFKDSKHVFDQEESIINALKDIKLTYRGSPFLNHEFQDSKSELLIQLSDIFIGLVGKLSTFINTNSPANIEVEIDRLSDRQKSSLDAFLELIDKSDRKNPAFFHNVTGISELDKFRLIFDMRGIHS